MLLKIPIRSSEWRPVHLIAIFVLLQLAVCLLTDGFALSFDESVWHYIGRNWFRHGLVPYSGGADNKSPFFFAIYGLSDKLFGVNYWFPRVLGTACECVSLLYVYKIGGLLASRQAGMLALQVYALSLLWHITKGKYPSLTETYEVTCIIISFYIYLTAQKNGQLLAGGTLAALGCAFRLTGFFPILAIAIYSLRRRRMAGFLFCLGVVGGICLLIVLLMFAGVRPADFFFYGFKDNFGAGTITDHPLSWKIDQFSEVFLYSEMLLLYPGAIVYLLIVKKLDLLTLWAIGGLAAVCAIGMYDGGHLKDTLPALSLMNGIAIGLSIEKYKLPAKKIVLVLWIVFFPKLAEPIASFKTLLTGSKHSADTFSHAPWLLPDRYSMKKLGRWIGSVTSEQDKVLIAGYGAQVQVYSERISPTIYFDADAMKSKMERARFKQDLGSAEPAMIAVPLFEEYKKYVDQETRDFIDTLTAKDYTFERNMYSYGIYRRRTNNP